jgi:predicted nucleotidyltransferase
MHEKSSNSAGLKVFRLNYELVFKRLKEYAERALEKGVIVVFLIGSLARGDHTALSDADVVIIVRDDYPKKLPDRISDFIDPTLPVDVEPRVYTLSEFSKMAQNKERIIKEIEKYGIVLAGDFSFVKGILQLHS